MGRLFSFKFLTHKGRFLYILKFFQAFFETDAVKKQDATNFRDDRCETDG